MAPASKKAPQAQRRIMKPWAPGPGHVKGPLNPPPVWAGRQKGIGSDPEDYTGGGYTPGRYYQARQFSG